MINSRTITLSCFLALGCFAAASSSASTDTLVEILEDDSLSHTGMMTETDTLEALVEQLEDAEESSVLDLFEEFVPEGMSVPSIESRSRVSRKLDLSRGFTEGRYLGSSWKSYERLKVVQGDHLAAGLLAEKDPGESGFNDFVTGYFRVKDYGPVRSLVLGDYIVEAGQGIALWRGYDFQKGAEIVLPVRRRGRGLVPYASSDENAYLRGAAAHLGWDDVSLTGFYSRKSTSATLDSSGNVSSVYTAGYFRTATEREKRNNVNETMLGLSASYLLSGNAHIGLTGYRARYSRELALSTQGFFGREINVISSDYLFSVESVQIFGEWGIINSHFGGVSGIHIVPTGSIDIVTVYREYPPEFINLHNNGFSERLGTSNERGWYLGVQFRPLQRVRLSGYFDLFSFPEKSATTLFTGGGHELLVQADVRPAPRLLVTPRFRRKVTVERKSAVDEFNRAVQFDDEKLKSNYRITAEYQLNKTTKLRTRFEYVELELRYLHRGEKGMLLYHDVVIKPSPTFTFSGRVAVFRTDSFDSGIGEYERDLPGVLTVPVLYGRGVRWYFLAQFLLAESLQFSVKYSELIRDDVKTIGTGLDELPTNRDSRIGLQLDCSF